MTVVYEIAIRAGVDQSDSIRRWFDAGPARIWPGLAQLRSFDAYFPSRGDAKDPYVDDAAAPTVLCMLGFADEGALRAALGGATFRRGLGGLAPNASITGDAMIRKFYWTDGEIGEPPLQAPFSYVVRYHRPAEDERAFVEHYVATHPALLATLPNIRHVLCYFPIAWRDPNALASAQYLIGNEVVFDSIDDFNLAMASPVRHELRAHFRQFPPFSGRNTHYPMHRIRLF